MIGFRKPDESAEGGKISGFGYILLFDGAGIYFGDCKVNFRMGFYFFEPLLSLFG